MAKKQDFKTVETDLEELEEKIKKHRRKNIRRTFDVIFVIVVIALIGWLWMALRSYDSYEVKNSVEQGDKSAVSFAQFCGDIVEYSNDGAIYMDSEANLIWNQSFEMTTPDIAICESYMTVFDKGGTELYVMSQEGVKGKIDTSMPILTACIANQGTTAVLVYEGQNYYVKLYDTGGDELASGEFFGEKGSIPVDIALSYDAKKLAVDMINIEDGAVSSTIAFYNFGSVGQNEIDNNVGTYSYDDVVVPEIEYISNTKMIAASDTSIMIFDGSEKPLLKQTIELEHEIDNLFYCDKYVGIAYSNNDEECTSHIIVYDLNGNLIMENDTSIEYTDIEFDSNNEVCVTNDYNAEIYTIHGVKKFSAAFDKELYKIMYKGSISEYVFISEGSLDEVRLK